MPELLDILRRHWGYDSFRPRQEAIVRSLLGGHDTCVVMPTGGGKSLCYQLPAAMQPERTVIVVSPLISLMQDQVAQLRTAGIAAALWNSALTPEESRRVQRDAVGGKFRLLYLSPERLTRADTRPWLERVPVSFFVVDEAHCISEWGHEFRPEYRQLSALRQHFPGRPIAAFTASATRRVRHDILEQLQLENPHTYIASFHRPNLRYLAQACRNQAEQEKRLLRTLRHYAGESAIVYAPTIARVEATAAWLRTQGIAALPYHGKMDAETRQRHQASWMADEVRVLVGTLAFGLGINKPAVRAVVHLALTKSIEQYYQEAGRGGRDGKPADCLLLWQKRDLGLLAHFVDTVEDAGEQERAWQRYHQIKRFVSASVCRHRQICLHFGETPVWQSCGACDVCAPLPDWYTARETAPTKQNRRKKTATPATEARGDAVLEAEPDEALYAHLAGWRRGAAQAHGVAAFLVLSNATLREVCRRRPLSPKELLAVPGIGEKKLEQFGAELLAAVSAFGS